MLVGGGHFVVTVLLTNRAGNERQKVDEREEQAATLKYASTTSLM